jgi:Mg2+ and Co2+ transporter CorA
MAKKISLIQLEQLVREGNGVSEIARKLKVSKGAVSKRLKALNVGIAKDVALRSAPEIVNNKLDAMDQLTRINTLIHKELNQIEESLETASAEDRKTLQDQKLKHVGEIRKQLMLLLDITSSLYDMQAVAAFQQEVLQAIAAASPQIRDRIIISLQERRAIRSTLELRS